MRANLRGMEVRMANGFAGDSAHGHAAALRQLWSLTYREAQTMIYADVFVAIAGCFALATALVPLMRRVGPPKGPIADVH